jgi:branched-chain amino acid transport system permease protein
LTDILEPREIAARQERAAGLRAIPFALASEERRQNRQVLMLLAGLAAVLAVLPFVVYPVFLMKVMCFAIFASGLNLLLGHGGLLSFGQAAYFGVAGFTTGYLAVRLGWSTDVALLAGVAASIMLGIVFGAIAVQRLGIYFSMITLALAQLIYFLAVQNPKITRGEDGLQSIPRGMLLGIIDLRDNMTLYVVVAIALIAALFFVHRVTHSPFGRVLRAIRDNEARARTLGYSVKRYKLMVFVLSAGLAGLAGSLKALVVQVVTLSDLHLSTSAEPILMILVGGIGTLFGPVLGAAVVVSMQYFLAPFGAWVIVIQGLIFILCVHLFKQGIVGLVKQIAVRMK